LALTRRLFGLAGVGAGTPRRSVWGCSSLRVLSLSSPCPAAHCKLVVLPHNLEGWGNLCEFITLGAPRCAQGPVPRGSAHGAVGLAAALRGAAGRACGADHGSRPWPCACAPRRCGARHCGLPSPWAWALPMRCSATACNRLRPLCGVPLVAVGNVHMHARSRKPLHDVLTAVRLGKPVAQCGLALKANAELHLRTRARLAALYPPAWLAATLVVAQRCSFSLNALRYQYPREAVLPGLSPARNPAPPHARRRPAAVPARPAGQRADADRARARADCRDALRDVFFDGVRHRAFRPQPGHLVPGTRIGGQLGGVLLPGRDRAAPGAHQLAV